MKRTYRIPTLPLAFLLASCPAAFAQPRNPASEVPAGEDVLIKKGLELRQTRQDEAALQEFRRAWALAKSGRALAQIALAEQALGRWQEAETHLLDALKHEGESWIARNRSLLDQAMFEIQGHLGWIELPGEAKAGWVSINGKQVAALPLNGPLRAPAGSVALEVQAKGYLPILRVLVVPPRDLAREPLDFVPSTLVAAPLPAPLPTSLPLQPDNARTNETIPEPTRASTSKTRPTIGAILGATAMVSLGTGIAFHVIREDRANAYNSLGCDRAPSEAKFQDCQSSYHRVTTANYLMIAGYAGAAVLSGAAVFLLFGGNTGGAGKTTSAAGEFHLRCGPGAGPGLVCAGRF